MAILETKQTERIPKSWGTALEGTISSAIMGEVRTVDIYLPESFSKSKRTYPVVFLTDGEYYFEQAALAVRQLSLAGHIPDCIVAAIETPKRRQDLTPPGMSTSLSDGEEARGEKFLGFITQELRPQLQAKFRAGALGVLMGHSHGGILCHYAAAKWRNDFPFIVSLDAPMQLDDGWLAKGLLDSVGAGGTLRLVSLEVRFGWSDQDWSRMLAAAPKEWKLVRRKLPDEDHESMVFAGFFEGLKEVFADFSRVSTVGLSTEDAFKHYEELAALYGSECTPPETLLRRALMNLTALGKAEAARRALKALEVGYGESEAETARLASEIDEAENALKGQETVQQLLASEPPTEAQMAPYLGIWRGSRWLDLDEGRKSPVIVTFGVKDGHGVSSGVNPDAPEEYRNETFQYLRVTQNGIEFGNLNGVFPPGVVASIGRLNGDKLEGESVFKGVYFKYPPGMKRPRHLFELRRE